MSLRSWVPLLLLAASGVGAARFIARDAFPYLDFSEESYGRHWETRFVVAAHVLASTCAILAGVTQLLPAMRQRWPRVHRGLGAVYVVGSLVGAPTAVRLSFEMENAALRAPILLLAAVWLATTLLAVLALVRRNFALHGAFMLRSFVLMNAFVLIRLRHVLPAEYVTGDVARVTAEWMCWVVPLGITEMWLSWRPAFERRRQAS